MKLYLAGTSGAAGQDAEAVRYAAGARNRLVSYYDIDENARSDGEGGRRGGKVADFWIDSTNEERQERAMQLYFAGVSGRSAREADVKLYVAGNGKSQNSPERDYGVGTRNRLISYAFVKDWAKNEFEFWVDSRPPKVSVFLDSGAYSAYSLGRKIDLGEYCAYLDKNKAALAAYAVLDVIGDAEATRVNMAVMRKRGLDPVPIFHVRSKPDVLEALLGDGATYIALGGMVLGPGGMTREQRQRELDPVMRMLEKHWPLKVHALGLMAQWALERYPFYSVDSSSAIMGAGMGRVTRFTDGQLTADGWRSDVVRTLDGAVADGIGRVKDENKARSSDSAHEGRRVRNIVGQLQLERYITDLWARKGVTWE